MKRIACLVLVAACTGTDGSSVSEDTDAGGSTAEPLCGSTLPASAPATIRIEGHAHLVDPSGSWTEPGVAIELRTPGASQPVATTLTSNGGTFTMTAPTQGMPIDGYVHAARPTFIDAYYFAEAPFAHDTALETSMTLVTPSDFTQLYTRGTAPPNTGVVVVRMHDCIATNVRGATVVVTPAGSSTIRYTDEHGGVTYTPNESTVSAIVSNAPAGPVTISTMNGTRLLRTGHATVFANSMSMVDLYPQ